MRDMRDVVPDLVPPQVTHGSPAPGRRVFQTATGFEATVHHVLYLPTNHNGNQKWPILVEWTGNGRTAMSAETFPRECQSMVYSVTVWLEAMERSA